MKIKIKNKKGFSFIEVMISVFILLVGILAVLGLMTSVLKNSIDAKNQEIAGFLSQEGVELVRNDRDNNWAAGHSSFSSPFPNTNKENCRIDMNSHLNNCNNGHSKDLYLNSQDFYVHNHTGHPTKFKREIKINYESGHNASNSDWADVIGMVTWDGASFPASLSGCNLNSKCVYTKVTLRRWGE